MTNPYDIPPAEPTGSATADEVFLSVGMALTQWEMLEQELADLFGSLCDTSSMAPSLAYGAVVASSSRGDMLKAAAASFYYLREVELAEVIKAVDFVGKLAGRRNDIAHGVVMDETTVSTGGFYLVPASYQTRKGTRHTMLKPGVEPRLVPKYKYTAAQILGFASAFAEAYRQIRTISFKVDEERIKRAQSSL